MNILTYMGETPLVEINHPYNKGGAKVLVKLEEFNPGGSIKSRVGLNMILNAEKDGLIKPGDTLIEATGGNTGLGLAVASSIKGYKLILVIPDNFSKEKVAVLKEYGAKIVLADHKSGNDCHIKKAEELMRKNPRYISLNQFENKANPQVHYDYTGSEILKQSPSIISHFVSVIGSGGTITGVSKRLRESYPNIKIIGVEPEGCDILNDKYIPHKIQATAVGKVGSFFDKSSIDSMISVDYDEVQELRKYLSINSGLFVGVSSGANILASLKIARDLNESDIVVTIAPDSGRSYLQM